MMIEDMMMMLIMLYFEKIQHHFVHTHLHYTAWPKIHSPIISSIMDSILYASWLSYNNGSASLTIITSNFVAFFLIEFISFARCVLATSFLCIELNSHRPADEA